MNKKRSKSLNENRKSLDLEKGVQKPFNFKNVINSLKPLFLFSLTVIVILGSAFAPLAVMKLEEDIIIKEPHQRAALGGELSGTNYMSWLIHALERDEPGYFQNNSAKITIDEDKVFATAMTKLREMAEAGILNKKYMDSFTISMDEDKNVNAQGEMDSFGFQRLNCYATDEGAYLSLEMIVESRTGKVISLIINSDAGDISSELLAQKDKSKILENYIDWLGLETLKDWTPVKKGLDTLQETASGSEKEKIELDSSKTVSYVSEEANLYAVISSGGFNQLILEVGVYNNNLLNWWLI